jgi:molybdopterin molybdotransferase
VRADFAYKKRPGRREYVRASLTRDGDAVVAHKYPKDGAGILSSIVHTDGFVIIGEAADGLQPGAMVDFLPYAEIIG